VNPATTQRSNGRDFQRALRPRFPLHCLPRKPPPQENNKNV
jgi:hypothetical protein